MTTAEQLSQFSSIVAAAKALRRSTRTINRLAQRFGITFPANNTMRAQYQRERERKAMAADVRRLARQRMSQREMCEVLGISRHVLRRVASENRININSRELY